MKSLDKNFRHLSREDKLKQLVDYGWLDKTNYQTLLSNPVIDEEVANSLIENVIGQGTLPVGLSLIHISEPTRPCGTSRMPSSA